MGNYVVNNHQCMVQCSNSFGYLFYVQSLSDIVRTNNQFNHCQSFSKIHKIHSIQFKDCKIKDPKDQKIENIERSKIEKSTSQPCNFGTTLSPDQDSPILLMSYKRKTLFYPPPCPPTLGREIILQRSRGRYIPPFSCQVEGEGKTGFSSFYCRDIQNIDNCID